MYFTEDFNSIQIDKLTGISRRTISDIYKKLKLRINKLTEEEEQLSCVIEEDKSYFSARKIHIKRYRGKGKAPVFGLLTIKT